MLLTPAQSHSQTANNPSQNSLFKNKQEQQTHYTLNNNRAMNKLQLPQAKLFYIVGQAYRKRMIDETERRILKEKIITDNVEIFQILEQNDTEAALIQKLIELVRMPEVNVVDDQNHNAVLPEQPPVEQEEASSPWGEFLRRKKYGMKGQQHGQEVQELKSLIKPEKAD